MSEIPIRRRDWLTTAAFTMAGVGGAVALWPFLAALGPDAETMAKRVTIDTSLLKPSQSVTIGVGSIPVLIIRRTESQLGWLRDPPLENGARPADSYSGEAYRDRDSTAALQPPSAANWHRSLKPEIMICVPICAHDPCVLHREDDWVRCPCCGSKYDLAGRAYSGPAKHNLLVPPHRYVDAETIAFSESEVFDAMQALRGNPG